MSTRDRLEEVALASFAARGYGATSLDSIASESGVRKQTLLYYHPSKDALLGAVIELAIAEMTAFIRPATHASHHRVDAVVGALFRIGSQRAELLDLVREVLRLGPPASTRLNEAAEPLIVELSGVVARHAVLGALAIVVGMATEVEVLRSLGVDPTLGELRRRRRILVTYLQNAALSGESNDAVA